MKERSIQWLTREVLTVSLSAFFADLGYQAVVGLFPLYITEVLHQRPFVFGVVIGFTYGAGAIISYMGGRLGDRFNKKRVAIAGNAAIPLLSFSGLSSSPIVSSAFYVTGWFSRDFRSPARRAWLAEIAGDFRSNVFGFLHGLDVGGGMVSVIIASLLILFHFSITTVMLLTAIPITISTLLLVFTRYRPEGANRKGENREVKGNKRDRMLFLASAGLFGFSYYSLGFPIITVAKSTSSLALGILTYAVFLGFSGLTGYIAGSMRLCPRAALSRWGYLIAALGTLFFAISYAFHGGIVLFYPSTALIGVGTGVIETYEPVMASLLAVPTRLSEGMGSLSALRSVGLFTSNLLMGLIFTVSIFFAYIYAFVTALCAAILLNLIRLNGPGAQR
jgi:MFS family permease